jgi:alkylhydroperoxidase/carboxymuconolactone decarboxylase family protein YurZ
MADHEERLRRLALHDQSFIESVLAMDRDDVEASGLDAKTHALVRLAALLSADAAPASCHSTITVALSAGATADEVVGVLIALTPVIGLARAVSAVPRIAVSIGYDIDAALETLGPPSG